MKKTLKRRFVCTITPNPALDIGGIVDQLKPNEKVYVRHETVYPGGNAINVGRILKRLGVPTICTGFLGGGIGNEIKFHLDGEGVRSRFVEVSGHSRISVTISNMSDHQQTRLSFHGPNISNAERKCLLQTISELKPALLVLGGSLPGGFGPSDISALVLLANKRGIPSIVDCPGDILRKIIKSKPTLIKPNLEEFRLLTGTRVSTIRSVLAQSRHLLKHVRYICVSSVEGGALLVSREGSVFGKIADIEIRSTVGAGDSLVGAMAAQFYNNNISMSELLRWGLAASAATLARPGTALGTEQEIRRIYQKTHVRSVE